MKKLIVAAIAALSIHANTTQAAVVTYNYTGHIGFVYQYFWGDNAHIEYPSTFVIEGSTLSYGDTFHGQFSYDTATRLSLTTDSEYDWITHSYKPSTTEFTGQAPLNAATLAFDGKSYKYVAPNNASDDGNKLTVYDNHQYLNDYFSHDTVFRNQNVTADLTIALANSQDNTVLNGPVAPATLTLDKFPRAFIDFDYRDTTTNYSFEVLGDIDSLEQVAAPVPEPEMYAMMLAGIAVLGWSARRRSQPSA